MGSLERRLPDVMGYSSHHHIFLYQLVISFSPNCCVLSLCITYWFSCNGIFGTFGALCRAGKLLFRLILNKEERAACLTSEDFPGATKEKCFRGSSQWVWQNILVFFLRKKKQLQLQTHSESPETFRCSRNTSPFTLVIQFAVWEESLTSPEANIK